MSGSVQESDGHTAWGSMVDPQKPGAIDQSFLVASLIFNLGTMSFIHYECTI